jgi:hypothetical protein
VIPFANVLYGGAQAFFSGLRAMAAGSVAAALPRPKIKLSSLTGNFATCSRRRRAYWRRSDFHPSEPFGSTTAKGSFGSRAVKPDMSMYSGLPLIADMARSAFPFSEPIYIGEHAFWV